MLLSKLLEEIGYERIIGDIAGVEIEGIGADSRHVMKGDLFICFRGGENDGHAFAAEAVSCGAAALVVERVLDLPAVQIVVPDGRKAMTEIAAAFYGHPERRLKIVGITGTNGKTTTAHMLAAILKEGGISCGNIGTLGIFYANKEISPELTTPDPIFLYKIFADMVASGVETVVMEVSAHALFYGKVDGIEFSYCIFTNLTEDHLDFFKTMDSYAAAKEKLFLPGRCDCAILNFDDEMGRRLAGVAVQSYSYALENPADVFAVDIAENFDGCRYVINLFDDLYEIRLNMTGLHNVYNSMAAAVCAAKMGIPVSVIAEGLASLEKVSGRLERVGEMNGADIFVDFAHTPDGLEKSLRALKPHCTGRLICLFGCGGNRDALKRPIMGEVSAQYSDFTVLTSDNPRYEDPFDIILEIEKGVRKHTDEYILVVDRESAIEYAMDKLRPGDVLLVAGKGGENYQEIMGVRHIYSDFSTIRNILKYKASEKSGKNEN